MRNTPTRPASPNTPSGTGAPRRTRPAKGLNVPATLWLPPADTVPESVLAEPAVLPTWALLRAVGEYTKPGDSVLAANTRGFYAGDRKIDLRPLPAHHDPHRDTRPAPHDGAVRLAVVEIETLPQGVLEIAYPHEQVTLVSHFVRPVIRAAAETLEPGGVLAIALAPDEPGHAAQHGSLVLHLACEAGFTYQQHIAVLTAELDGERILARVTTAQARAVNAARRHNIPALAPAHLDLAIFTRAKETTLA